MQKLVSYLVISMTILYFQKLFNVTKRIKLNQVYRSNHHYVINENLLDTVDEVSPESGQRLQMKQHNNFLILIFIDRAFAH